MDAAFVRDDDTVVMTAAAALSPGALLRLADGRGAVYQGSTAAAIGDVVSLKTKGVFDLACASGTTFTAFDVAVWDVSANVVITTPGADDDFVVGRVVRAKVSGELVVRVELNAAAGGNEISGLTALRAVNIDHADAAEYEVLTPEQNVTGMAVPILRARVTEVMVGSSEDQMIVGLYDEDDNLLGNLTATNGAADTVGVIHFSGTCKNIPAGKGAYVKYSQTTAGGTPAGAMQIQAFVTPLVA